MLSPFIILTVLALIFAVLALVWPNYPLLPVSVILLSVALLIGAHVGHMNAQAPNPLRDRASLALATEASRSLENSTA